MEKVKLAPWRRPPPAHGRSVALVVSLCITVAVLAAMHLAAAISPPDVEHRTRPAATTIHHP